MTRGEIIRMATEAGGEIMSRINRDYGESVAVFYMEDLERFAHAAYEAGAAAERERIIAANAPEIERINAYIKEGSMK